MIDHTKDVTAERRSGSRSELADGVSKAISSNNCALPNCAKIILVLTILM